MFQRRHQRDRKKKVTIAPDVFDAVKQEAESLYATIQPVRCPYLNSEVTFNAKGLEHLKFKKKNKARPREDQFARLRLLKYVPDILKLSRTLQGLKRQRSFELMRTNQRNETILMDVVFYEFVAIVDNGQLRVRVIVKQVGESPPYFWSVIPFWKGCSTRGDRTMHYGDPARD